MSIHLPYFHVSTRLAVLVAVQNDEVVYTSSLINKIEPHIKFQINSAEMIISYYIRPSYCNHCVFAIVQLNEVMK